MKVRWFRTASTGAATDVPAKRRSEAMPLAYKVEKELEKKAAGTQRGVRFDAVSPTGREQKMIAYGMRLRSTALLVSLIAIVSCGREASHRSVAAKKGSPIDVLNQLAVPPEQLPGDCDFKWVSPPQVLSTSSEEDREFLGTLSMFWFGRPIDPDLVYAASSNVYGTPSEDMAVVIFSLYYRDTKEAEKAGRFLQSMYSESTSHTIGQYDKLVIGFACLSEESRGCFQLLQSHIERLATKLMEESTASTS